jgi:hypothetical protein
MPGSRAQVLVLIVLLTIGLSAAATIWYSYTWTQVLASTHEVASLKLDTLVERTSRFDAAIQLFLRGREGDVTWFTGTSALVDDLQSGAAELDAAMPGVAMAPRARLAEALQRARETVDGARANFDAGSTLMALDAVESNGQPATASLWSELQALRVAVAAETAAARVRWWQRAGAAAAIWALTWAAGLAWLARRRPTTETEVRTEPVAAPIVVESRAVEPAPPARPPPPRLAEVADVCEHISRLRNAADVPPVLTRSAALLQASGLVLWVRDADALVVGAAHGYPDGLAQRLGRVALADENLITRAWHSGQCQTSTAGAGRRAAFAAPLVGASGPVGVLAAELAPDADLENVAGSARLVAGQFAAVLGESAVATPNALAG